MNLRECTVRGVFVMVTDQAAAPTVIIDVDTESCIPIFIGLWEAISIFQAIRGEIPSRPLTHDLFIELMEHYGITLSSVHIDALENGIFYAKLLFNGTSSEKAIDCRPSDGIAIALRAQVPLFIDDAVIQDASVDRKTLSDLRDVSTYFQE
ncbi:MAG: bifunctional nuclease family protein [Methanomicrobiales archaeon]|nr:bifunctional nuclease family protein [Methanomicrobiales archaeon]